jgi:hypothetical protein
MGDWHDSPRRHRISGHDVRDGPAVGAFQRPLLADVNEPATAAFYSAYSAAQALHTPAIPSDEDAITAFVAAASSAQRAFESADANARSKAQRGKEGRSLPILEGHDVGLQNEGSM